MKPLKRDLKDLDSMKKLIIAPLMMISFLTIGGCAIKSDNNVEKYETLYNEMVSNQDFHTELYIFPKKIDTKQVVGFSSKSREDLFNGSYLFYLVMKYEESQFNAELERLDAVKAEIEIPKNIVKTKYIIKDTKTSQYVTINKNSRYEYAKYNAETYEIVYVSNQLFSWAESGIKEEHRFKDITIPNEIADGKNAYNMYYYYEADIGYYVK